MESLTRYLSKQPKYKDRIFISDPPNSAMLVWTNSDFLPNISGISIVEKRNANSSTGISGSGLSKILREQLFGTVPILNIIYEDDMSKLNIDGVDYTLEEGAKHISECFHIKIGSAPAKQPNDASQIIDPFHIWSRGAFDGISVMKTDIDFLIVDNNKISVICEVKRSSKVKVGIWKPYIDPNTNNDINNYYILMSLSNLLKAKMVTIHHEEMNSEIEFTGEEKTDSFLYEPQPNYSTLSAFAARKTDTTRTIKNLFHIE